MHESLKDSIDYLILDEAQDFPLELLEILNHLAKNATVFGDSQQALDQSSTTSDFSHAFNAERRVYYLSQNYRNTVEIASVAQLFYAGDPHDIPARPRSRGEKPRLIQCANSAEMAKIVSNYYNNNKSQHIGVLTPTHTHVKRFQDELKITCRLHHRYT
jgi:DNA helicase II / ATP-dependent DNA helicase PcrA